MKRLLVLALAVLCSQAIMAQSMYDSGGTYACLSAIKYDSDRECYALDFEDVHVEVEMITIEDYGYYLRLSGPVLSNSVIYLKPRTDFDTIKLYKEDGVFAPGFKNSYSEKVEISPYLAGAYLLTLTNAQEKTINKYMIGRVYVSK